MINLIIDQMVKNEKHQELLFENHFYFKIFKTIKMRYDDVIEEKAIADILIALCETLKDMQDELTEVCAKGKIVYFVDKKGIQPIENLKEVKE